MSGDIVSSEIWNDCFVENIGDGIFNDDVTSSNEELGKDNESKSRKAELLVENIRVIFIFFFTSECFSTFEVSTHYGKSIKVTLGSYFMRAMKATYRP